MNTKFRHLLTATVLLPTLLLLQACSVKQRPMINVIGVDLQHAESWPGLAKTLAARGFTVMPINHAIDQETLNKIGILLVLSPTKPYARQEIKNITRFVKEGGGILCAGQTWSWTYPEYENKPVDAHPLNQLGKSLRFTVTKDSIGMPETFETEIMAGIGSLARNSEWWPSKVEFRDRDAEIVVRDEELRTIGGMSTLGYGRIVVFGHAMLLEENPDVLKNSVSYLSRQR